MDRPTRVSSLPIDRLLVLGAITLMILAVLVPLTGRLPGAGAQLVVLVAAALAVAG